MVPAVRDDLTAFVYTWVDAYGVAGAALSVFGERLPEQIFEKVDGIEVPDTQGFDDYRVGPLHMSLAPDGATSQVRFDGDRVSLSLAYDGFHQPYRYGTHADGCPGFFADDRLEQSGRARGVLTLDGAELEFDTVCQRDHSWGERDWAAMHHMKWINALTPAGDAVHAVELLAFGQRYLRGYVLREGQLAQLDELRMNYELDNGMLHRSMEATFIDQLGRSTEVAFTDGGPHFEWDVNPRLTLRDTAMRARLLGRDAAAYVDMSWEPDYFEHRRQAGQPVAVST
ncbi:hypothetical protein ACN94_18360 [Gordonia paraffinivorans]|nr:hypothetical protein [Gordonia paraffinivorans]